MNRSAEDVKNDFPHLGKVYKYPAPEPGEEVVISGIAGRFPDSDNVNHLKENLYNKVDLISDDGRRWKLDHPEIPQRTGKINNVTKFDASFFGVHFKQAHTMDPMCRMLLEHTFEALVDAGVNPRQLRGTRTGVFIGACFSESEKTWFYEKLQVNGFGITGCSRAMLANRVSYWLGIHGPSYTVDSACSSSLFAMDQAFRAIRSGQCDAAIVGGSNLCLHPYVSLQFSRLGVLSADGRCKCFDEEANGYTRSEAVSVIFMQKAKDAKRIYAQMIHGKTNSDGFKEQGITFPSSRVQSLLFREFYEECGVDPSTLAFMEAHGTGTKVGDPEEVNAIDQIFCPGRDKPLYIGSVKSNLGHSEPASGLCSIAKVIIGMENDLIPPNLHYNKPREGLKAVEEGRIKVVSDPIPFEGGLVGVNSFGFGGANAHILLKSNPKSKVNGGMPKDNLPRLIVVSGRTENAAHSLIDDAASRLVDAEYVRLLQDVHIHEIPGHIYRGYAVLHTDKEGTTAKEVEYYPGDKRELWFVFSGMGSQWATMGAMLMNFPVFANAIAKCDAVLKPHGVDIINILTNNDKTIFDNILNSFVGIAAIQIGLVDLLTSIGIVPDKIIGHSVGELGCAYADGCFTAEQMILAAYSRGRASVETKFIFGSMAAVGLGYNDVKDMCPPDIEIACHNSVNSSTISGPAESMKAFVAKLQAEKIFAKEVPCSNIAYHSRYIQEAGPKLLEYLRKVIPEPKERSPKWLSTSVPRSEWNTNAAKYSSAEYHTNNLLSPVLFEETSRLIPKDAVTIEIAPHGLLQAILKRSLNPSVTNIALTQRGRNNVEIFLQAIGRLYNVGFNPDVAKLYPDIEFPVSRGTPMISPHVKWEHSDDWFVTSYRMQEKIVSGERSITIELTDETYEYMAGHVIDGRNLLPATGYLAIVWETIGMMKGELYTEISIVFEDIRFLRATTLPKDGSVDLIVMIQKGTGRFEVIEGTAAVVTGKIQVTSHPNTYKTGITDQLDEDVELPIKTKDIYKEMRLRGYQYSGVFRSLDCLSVDALQGKIVWRNNWVAFMDNMLQMVILTNDNRGLYVPTRIEKMVIDTKFHLQQIHNLKGDGKLFPVRVYKEYNLVVSGGVEIFGAKASSISRRKPAGEPVLEEYKFVPYIDWAETSVRNIIRLATHIALENSPMTNVKTLELVDDDETKTEDLISPVLQEALGDIPLIQANVTILAKPDRFQLNELPPNVAVTELKKLPADTGALIAVGKNLLANNRSHLFSQLNVLLKDNGYLLTLESSIDEDALASLHDHQLNVVLGKLANKQFYVLIKKRKKTPKITKVVRVQNDNFSWLKDVQDILNAEEEFESGGNVKLVLVGEKDYECGLLGLYNCLMREPGGEIIKCVMIQDDNAPEFSLDKPLYQKQLQLNLNVNVFKDGKWGSYRHLPLEQAQTKMVNHALANVLVRADLSSLKWIEGALRPQEMDDYAQVCYAAINFKDVMVATGKLSMEVITVVKDILDCPIGFEYSGYNKKGTRVAGLVVNRAFSNYVKMDPDLTWEIPDNWSLEEAVTFPCTYATCYYSLIFFARLKRGEKVLIHSGTGGVGQAAINLCLYYDCEIFTTVGTPEKREFIKKHFPSIKDSHIGNSRDTSFEQMIARETNGKGVDIVLNSLAEEKLHASVRCLGMKGRFLEIGKFDLAANSPLGMEIFLKEASFFGVMMDNVFGAPPGQKIVVKNLLQAGLDSGAVKPLVRTIFPKDEIEAAFRYMAAGKHMGKVILKVQDKENLGAPMLALPRYYPRPERTYVILGGLGGFGLELCDWLISRGATKLVLTSRKGMKNGYQKMKIHIWKGYGIHIEIITGKDASKQEDCEYILKKAGSIGPVDAIFNLAVVLKDSIMKNQTVETFEESFRAKAWATKMLDKVSRKLCPQLRHFVVFSSVSCGRGNAGQSNYGMSNSVMERICEKRSKDGLPALAIQWGAVGDVGLVADMQDNDKELVIGGTLQQKISSCLQELDKFLTQEKPIVCSMVVAEKRTGGAGALNPVDAVLHIMGMKDLKTVSMHTSLAELGMDSMMAVEIKQTLEREYEVFLTAQDIRILNFAKLTEISAKYEEANKKKRGTEKESAGSDKLVGLNLLLRLIGSRDLSNEVCVPLPISKVAEGRKEVFLIPGMEGCGDVFLPLATKIKAPATCLQLGVNLEHHNSIPEMADFLLPYVLERSKNRRDFVIVGYSFGSLIAIELVRRLEAEGLIGRLILIDGAPEQMKTVLHQQLHSSSEEELQSNVLIGIMDILAPTASPKLLTALEKLTTWDDRLSAFLNIIPKSDEIKLTHANKKSLCTAIYKRLTALENYDISKSPPIRTPILLLKPSLPSCRIKEEDYGLQKITKDKVEFFTIDGNHVTMLENDKISQAINGDPLEDASAFKARIMEEGRNVTPIFEEGR
ncbi:fatty acid synthase [Prorops nasuta]|uniref:fatty acid synthase n=1 Tax=Prorops nasuta TaxID=863751 RepID=UPI0034CD1F2A